MSRTDPVDRPALRAVRRILARPRSTGRRPRVSMALPLALALAATEGVSEPDAADWPALLIGVAVAAVAYGAGEAVNAGPPGAR